MPAAQKSLPRSEPEDQYLDKTPLRTAHPALVVIVAVVFVGAYWVGSVAVRPIVRQLARSGRGDNEIVGAVLAAFGVLYGLLLSLIAVAAYENLNLVESQAANEASAILALHRDVGEYPSPLKERLQAQLRDYCQMITDEEWPLFAQWYSSALCP